VISNRGLSRKSRIAARITSRDWQRVQKIASAVADATARDAESDRRSLEKQMLALLDSLERQYGRNSTIVATRADYTDEPARRLRLLRQAYSHAKRASDVRNLWLVACSLAEYYIEEKPDVREAQHWLKTMRAQLRRAPDSDGARWARDLAKALAAMRK
jgi:hypothetical protein